MDPDKGTFRSHLEVIAAEAPIPALTSLVLIIL
jgi:hypothetical protein